MRYVDQFALNIGAGGLPASHIFRANGLFDPNNTGTGHQPMGYDQWMAFYDHWTVLGAKCTVEAHYTNAGATEKPAILAINVTDNNSSISDPNDILEQGGCTWKSMNQFVTTKLSKNYSTKKFFGCVNVMDRNDLKGNVTSDPADGAFFTIYALPTQAGEDNTPIYCTITISYIVCLSEAKDLAGS